MRRSRMNPRDKGVGGGGVEEMPQNTLQSLSLTHTHTENTSDKSVVCTAAGDVDHSNQTVTQFCRPKPTDQLQRQPGGG